MNGCFNREALSPTILVQSGWTVKMINCVFTRLPVIIEIVDPMSKDCQYQKLHKDDDGCKWCKWLT